MDEVWQAKNNENSKLLNLKYISDNPNAKNGWGCFKRYIDLNFIKKPSGIYYHRYY
jgi:hypothetical protein